MNNRTLLPMVNEHQKRRSDSCASWASLQFSMDCSEATSHGHSDSYEKSSLYPRNSGELSNILDQVSRLSLEPPLDLSAMKTPENEGRPILTLSEDKHDFNSRDIFDVYRRFDTPRMMDAPLIPESPDLSIANEDAGDRPAVGSHRPPLLQPFFSPVHNRNLVHAGAARYALQFSQSAESTAETSRYLWASPKSISSRPPPPMPMFGTSPGQTVNHKLVAPQPVNALKMRKAVPSAMELS